MSPLFGRSSVGGFGLKILHVIPDLKQASGPSAFCVKVCDQLAEEGLDVAILHGGAVEPTSLLPENQKVQLVDDFKFFNKGIMPDLVHVHSLWAPVSHAGVSFARRHKIPYVISAHGMLAPWAMNHKWLKKRIAWWLYQKRDLQGAALFHVTAPCEVEWLRGLGFKQPCVLAPLGSDLPDLNNVETQRRRDVKTVLFVGRIYPVKGLMNLVKAWVRLKESVSSEPLSVNGHAETQPKTADDSRLTVHGVPWQLVIAGPDQAGHKAELVAEAERLGLTVSNEPLTVNRGVTRKDAKAQSSDQVKEPQKLNATDGSPLTAYGSTIPDIVFTGPVYGADKDALYRMADLFVLPSYTENFGVVVTDSLSYGVPVITTKGAPWSELLGSPKRVNSKPLIVNSEPCCEGDDNQLCTVYDSQLTDFTANGRCGWWIDIGVEPLSEALREAVSLRDVERRQMGLAGRNLVENRYTWPKVASEMKTRYERILRYDQNTTC